MEELLSDDGEYMADKIQVTPVQLTQVRQSQKISGKKFKFAETSPENSSGQSELVKTIHLMKKMETCVGIWLSIKGREEPQADITIASAGKLLNELPAKKEKPIIKDGSSLL